MILRMVNKNDSSCILDLYKPYVLSTPITFEYDLPLEDEFKKRIIHKTEKYPWIVCEHENKILAYAYTSPEREKEAYQWNCELSIYVDERYHRKKIAAALCRSIIDISIMQNYKNIYSFITIPNYKSIAFHNNFGFEKVGVYKSTGYKMGKWHDVACFVKRISEYDIEPQPTLKISEIKNDNIEQILLKNLNLIKSF